jgi:hypothetical protein
MTTMQSCTSPRGAATQPTSNATGGGSSGGTLEALQRSVEQLTNATSALAATLGAATLAPPAAPNGGGDARPATTKRSEQSSEPSTPPPTSATPSSSVRTPAAGISDSLQKLVDKAERRATSSGVGDVVKGKVSWYGGPNDGEDNDKPASGVPNTVPGIAIMNPKTLGGWWEVTIGGKQYNLQQTDIGPAAWTGKKIDFNHSAVKALGFTEKSFPTGSTASARYLGPNP